MVNFFFYSLLILWKQLVPHKFLDSPNFSYGLKSVETSNVLGNKSFENKILIHKRILKDKNLNVWITKIIHSRKY